MGSFSSTLMFFLSNPSFSFIFIFLFCFCRNVKLDRNILPLIGRERERKKVVQSHAVLFIVTPTIMFAQFFVELDMVSFFFFLFYFYILFMKVD